MNIKTTLTHAATAVALLSTSAFAAAQTAPATQEAMKHSNPRAEAAAESKVDSKGQAVDKSAKQPEAMKQGSDKAKTSAEAKVARKPATVKKNRADEQMSKDAKKL